MPDRSEPILAIVDGSLESLIACALLERPDRALAWFVGAGDDDADLRRAAVELQADLLGMDGVHEPAAEAWSSLPGGFGESALLIAAVAAASRDARSRVLWPKNEPDDLGMMMDASDRALLIQRLGMIETEESDRLGVRIDTPILDLPRSKLIDLAVDLDVPAWSAWWALPAALDHRPAQRERAGWVEALEAAGAAGLLERPRAVVADA